MTVTFNIRNVTNGEKNVVMLRKFFQMVFVGNDRKSLHIYTATVLGGCHSQSSENDSGTNYISSLDSFQDFCIRFGFVITGNDNNDVISIENEDVTQGENGFLNQIDCIRQVWGAQCEVIFGNQGDLQKHFNLLLDLDNADGKSPNSQDDEEKQFEQVPSKMAQNRILWIEDNNKPHSGSYMKSIAVPGKCLSENYFVPKENSQRGKSKAIVDEGSEKAFYCVTTPDTQNCCRGIELLNWVKTTIVFERQLNDPNLNFCIKKEADENTTYLAPDFTWYFSPPVKSYINHESSSVEVSWQRVDKTTCDRHDQCQCPVKPDAEAQYTSKRYDNAINPVANKTTVNFHRWVDDEMINYRQKYRIAAKNIFPRAELLNDIRELNIYIDTSDEHNRGNRQYVLGLFISFALSFGIDKTRLEEAQKYFPFQELFLADTWWLVLIIALSLSFLIRPPHNILKEKYIRYIRWRKVNIYSALGWIIVAFCLDKSKYITDFLFSTLGIRIISFVDSLLNVNINYYWFPQGIFLLILGSNLLYLYKNIKKYHDPILSSLFGDDIL